MKISYLLEDTALAGGIRVIVAHADALIDRGHELTLVTKGGPLTWRRSRARWEHVRDFREVDGSAFDFVVGTFWTTVADAYALAGARAVHFCQGYEGSFSAYAAIKDEIDAVYRLPIPKICVSPYLVEVCRGFHDDATYVGQIVDDEFFRDRLKPVPTEGEWGCGDRLQPVPRVLLVGPFQANFVKGIDLGYDAVRRARAGGAELDLIRVSQWVVADDEPAELAQEFHVAVDTAEMARLYATADVYLGPNRRQEGFGLPAAEALAGGVPAILTRIPSYLWWDDVHDYALFVPENDSATMAEALLRLLGDAELRARLARRGQEVAEQFRSARTGERLERFFQSR